MKTIHDRGCDECDEFKSKIRHAEKHDPSMVKNILLQFEEHVRRVSLVIDRRREIVLLQSISSSLIALTPNEPFLSVFLSLSLFLSLPSLNFQAKAIHSYVKRKVAHSKLIRFHGGLTVLFSDHWGKKFLPACKASLPEYKKFADSLA